MPELGEQMYCSQQICIPPTFPYLLRQFAKAAIRTQPNDLLKWSTTYFRCLSLNIPPPVKPRLEYPIPKDHHGMTPGWLRALLHQMAGSNTVTFKVLWDRWIGACLEHPNLIQILVLGGFEDNKAVPWLRFIGLCAGHLTENLTQTMHLICEILTEEPEGGSAMISVEIFLDLYKFLAKIDASVPQTLRNYYFLDKFLELYQEKIAKEYEAQKQDEELAGGSLSLASSVSTMKAEKEVKKDEGSLVSCPSITSQEPDNYEELLMKITEEGGEEFFGEEQIEDQAETESKAEVEDGSEKKEDSASAEDSVQEDETKDTESGDVAPKTFSEQVEEDKKTDIFQPEREDAVSENTKTSSETITEKDDKEKEEEENLLEDLARLKEQELMGEGDDDIEQFKASILAEAGLTPSQMAAVEQSEVGSSESVKTGSVASEPSEKEAVDEREYEDVFVDAVPGIGPKVPDEMVADVCNYMKEVAKVQHGMVMPRNIRHFECPPLEVYRD